MSRCRPEPGTAAHVLRAASRITDDPNIVVIGSQAILGSYHEDELPPEAVVSMEADIAFRDDPHESKADAVDGAIGEASQFHETYAYYAQGVSVSTATLPSGWEERVIAYDRPDALPSRAVCLETHDLVISKLVAGREKDGDFAIALVRAELVNPAMLLERADLLPVPGGVITRVRESVNRCVRRAERG
jgi:hypothetical protein